MRLGSSSGMTCSALRSTCVGCLVNARARPQHAFGKVAGGVEVVPAFAMTYCDFKEAGAQLEAMLASFA
jgi:hypothetical protein